MPGEDLESCSVCGAPLSHEVCSVCGTRALQPGPGKETPSQQPTSPSVGPSLIGRELQNQYRITQKLGEGGFGAVYIAEEPRFARKVAIKTLHARLSHDTTLLERFRREGMAASRLEHPAAVKVFNLGQTDDGVVWMAMELLNGKTLAQLIEEKKILSLEETCAFLKPICEVLEEAHQKGIVHRDLKPQNIISIELAAGGTAVKVLDFGIAKLISADTLTQSFATVGTPAFMAPEQWEDSQSVDGRADIYALGLITYRCLSGRLPFEAKTASAWMKKHCLEAPTSLASLLEQHPLAPALSTVVMKALEKSPEARYQTAMEFYRALEKASVQPQKTEPAPTPKEPEASPPPSPKKPPYVWIGLAAVLALLLLWRPWKRSAQEPPPTPPKAALSEKETKAAKLTPKQLISIQPPKAAPTSASTQSAPTSAAVTPTSAPTIPEEAQLRAIITAGPDELYIVGGVGTILYSSDGGLSWKREEVPEDGKKKLFAAWWDGKDSVYAVGRNDTLLKKTKDGPWRYIEVGVNYDFHAIWGSSPENIYLVGSSGFLARYNKIEDDWDELEVIRKTSLQDIFGNERGVFVVGDNGTLLQIQNGDTVFPLNSGTQNDLYSVWGDSEAFYAVGAGSTFLMTTDNGRNWQPQNVPDANQDLIAVFGMAGALYLLSEAAVYYGPLHDLKKHPFPAKVSEMAGSSTYQLLVLSDQALYQSGAADNEWKPLPILLKDPQ